MSPDITVAELKTKMDNQEKFLLLDVREQMEFDTFNLNGMLIPLGSLMSRMDEIEDFQDQEVIVHCRSGARSATAKHILQQAGFKNVKNLLGGVLAWIEMESPQ